MTSIKQLSAKHNITPRTIRFYEELGIVKPNRNGLTREYSNLDEQRLELTLHAKSVGISLNDMVNLFELYDEFQTEETQLFRFIQLIRSKKRELKIKKESLSIVLEKINNYEKQCLAHIQDKGLIS